MLISTRSDATGTGSVPAHLVRLWLRPRSMRERGVSAKQWPNVRAVGGSWPSPRAGSWLPDSDAWQFGEEVADTPTRCMRTNTEAGETRQRARSIGANGALHGPAGQEVAQRVSISSIVPSPPPAVTIGFPRGARTYMPMATRTTTTPRIGSHGQVR